MGSSQVRPDSLISKDDGLQYWESVDADDNGMLGGIPLVEGFSTISKVDLQGSRSFLAKLGIGSKNGRRGVAYALEGGAGCVLLSIHPSIILPLCLALPADRTSRVKASAGSLRVSCRTLPRTST